MDTKLKYRLKQLGVSLVIAVSFLALTLVSNSKTTSPREELSSAKKEKVIHKYRLHFLKLI